jgi:hypothetical protein
MTKADLAIPESGAIASIIGAHLAHSGYGVIMLAGLYAAVSMRDFAGIDQIWGALC